MLSARPLRNRCEISLSPDFGVPVECMRDDFDGVDSRFSVGQTPGDADTDPRRLEA